MISDPKPRVTGTTHTLPFDKLSAEAFERLTLWLVRREGFARVQHLGEAGSEQGRDILAWKEGRRFAFQCKRVRAFSAAEGKAEIRKLRVLETDEQPQEVVFVLPIALRAATRKAIWKAWGDEATCYFWVGNELDERAKRHPDIVREFFQIAVEGAKPSLFEAASGVTLIPRPPVHYIAREEALAALRAKLLAPGSTRLGNTRPRLAVGVQGMGGIGKSVLAAALALEQEVKAAFPDGIFWVAVGRQPDLRRLQIELATAASEARPIIESVHQGKLLLSRLLAERTVLVVLDDLWNLDDAAAFDVLGPRGRLLITTRHADLLVGLGAEEFRVEVLTPKAALGLLADWAGDEVDRLPPEAAKVARRCGYLPLALAMIGAMVRLRPTAWSDALERLDQADLDKIRRNFPDYPYPDLLRALAVSVETLAPEERERYLELAVFPEEALIPEATVETLWASSGLSAPDARDLATKLVARSLAQPAGEGQLRVHDLQVDYLRHEVGDLCPLHLRLVEAYSAHCPRGFASGPKDGYYFQNLAHHLLRAGRGEDLRALLLDYAWIEAKLEATNINALLADFDALPEDTELRLVQGALRLSAHVLAERPAELPGQLFGRLVDRSEPGIVAFLSQTRSRQTGFWLRPLAGMFASPEGALVRTLIGPTRGVNALAVLPDGRVVSGSDDSRLRVWDLSSGETLRTLEGHAGRVTALAVLPDGRVVSASEDRTLRLWDVDLGETLKILEGHTLSVAAVVALRDGRVVSGSGDRTLRLWDVDLGETLKILEGHTLSVAAVVALRDGRVVSGSQDGTLRLWDVELGETLKILDKEEYVGWRAGLLVLPEDDVVFNSRGNLKVWNMASCWTVGYYEFDDEFDEGGVFEGPTHDSTALAVLPGGNVILASDYGALEVWDSAFRKKLKTLKGHCGEVTALAALPDGRVVSSSHDGTLRVWSAVSGEPMKDLEGHWGEVTALAALPDGRVVSSSRDSTLQIWDPASAKTSKKIKGDFLDFCNVDALAVLPDGRVLFFNHGRQFVLDLAIGTTAETQSYDLLDITALAVLPDGRVVFNSRDPTLRLWDVASGKILKTLRRRSTGRVTALEVLPGGCVVAGYADHTLRIWNMDSGKSLKILRGHSDTITAVVALPGVHVVSGSSDHTLRLWDVASGKIAKTLEGHSDAVTALAALPDGRVVSASGDSSLRVWNMSSGETLARITLDASPTALAILPGGDIVTGDYLGGINFFRVEEPR